MGDVVEWDSLEASQETPTVLDSERDVPEWGSGTYHLINVSRIILTRILFPGQRFTDVGQPSHISGEDTEAQRKKVSCLRSYGKCSAEPRDSISMFLRSFH